MNISKGKPTLANKAQQIARLMQLGVAKWEKGQHKDAQVIFKNVLDLKPDHFDALQLSAIIAGQSMNFELALSMLDKILKLRPNFADAYSNRGLALEGLNKFNEAVISFNRAIDLKADHFQALFNLGRVLSQLELFSEAVVSYDKAIVIKSDYAAAYNNRGNALKELKRLDDALVSYDRAIAINPDFAEAYNNRGNLFKELKRFDDALVSYNHAIAINPNFAEAYINRGNALKEFKRLDEALVSYDRAIAIKHDFSEAFNNRGNVLMELRRLEDALASYNLAIAINPNYVEAYNNCGVALQEFKCLDDALASYNRAIAIKPDYAEAYWNKSLLLLLSGEIKQGWDLYEWRWKREERDLNRNFTQPPWLGSEDITNKTIMLHAEQGLGDTIQFCRYVKLVKERGARVLLEVPKALVGLLKTLDGVDELIEKGKPLPTFDYHCPLLSLPLAFKTEFETIPNAQSYLFPDNEECKEWANKLGESSKLRIGIVWSGSAIHKNDHNRSLSLQELLPYLPKECEYVSLQKEVRETDKDVLATSGIKHFGAQLNDFTDTAALCELMDIVISVDTSVAHLAGALGKTTWILLPFSPDWRWLLDRDDSPWYPTVKLYRQDNIGDWSGALEKVKSDLTNHK